jgi:hypothetical protein
MINQKEKTQKNNLNQKRIIVHIFPFKFRLYEFTKIFRIAYNNLKYVIFCGPFILYLCTNF